MSRTYEPCPKTVGEFPNELRCDKPVKASSDNALGWCEEHKVRLPIWPTCPPLQIVLQVKPDSDWRWAEGTTEPDILTMYAEAGLL